MAAKNQERMSNPPYPHTMSRGGYKKVREKLKEKKLEALKASGDHASIDPSQIDIPRHENWLEGRRKADGSFTREDVAVIAKRMVSVDSYFINYFHIS